MTINYVAAFWFGGPRYSEYAPQVQDRGLFLREHVAQLQVCPPSNAFDSVTQITFVVNGVEHPAEVDVPAQIHGIPVVVLHRENEGLSYGAWRYVWETYRDAFSHYIWTEDDYVFTCPQFDRVLHRYFTAEPRFGMVCGLFHPAPPWTKLERNHAAVSCCMVSAACLAAVEKQRTRLFVGAMEAAPYASAWHSQIHQASHMEDAGYIVKDWCADYATCYRDNDTRMTWYGRTDHRALLVPLQNTEPSRNDHEGRTFVVYESTPRGEASRSYIGYGKVTREGVLVAKQVG